MSGLATAAVMAASLALFACRPQGVALPPQRPTYTGPERKAFGPFARISDPHSGGNLVEGVRPEGRWAWTARRSRLRFWLEGAGPWKFSLDVFFSGQTLKQTGPVMISCFIDGKPLGALRGDAPHEFFFEKPVPAGWLDPSRPVEVVLEADKVWHSADGGEFAFLLVGAGFLPQ